MNKPTIREAIEHLREHYGLTMSETLELVRTPLHPAGMCDEFALHAMQGLASLDNVNYRDPADLAARSYRIADAMLKERAK